MTEISNTVYMFGQRINPALRKSTVFLFVFDNIHAILQEKGPHTLIIEKISANRVF